MIKMSHVIVVICICSFGIFKSHIEFFLVFRYRLGNISYEDKEKRWAKGSGYPGSSSGYHRNHVFLPPLRAGSLKYKWELLRFCESIWRCLLLQLRTYVFFSTDNNRQKECLWRSILVKASQKGKRKVFEVLQVFTAEVDNLKFSHLIKVTNYD